jgi:hypothetical protein
MKRCEIDMFSSYEFVPGLFAQVFDIVDEKGVDEGLLDQQDDLGTARCKIFDYLSTDSRCASLAIVSTFKQ